ncbi:MAG: glycosyltransferase family 4 protein [candidate division WOR-3 bacterium]|nr:MAG: glycosyltransferase family 4 protein [candidate division WOR-3 bacterium]
MKKIIHLYYRSHGSFFPERDSDYYFLAGWSGAIARRTVEYIDKYQVENWRPERTIDRQLSRNVQGVMCRLFPARHVPYFGDYSPSLLRELKRQCRAHEILIHHNGIHSNPLYLMSFLLKGVPIVAQHHGDSPSIARFHQNGNVLNLLSSVVERRALMNIDHFFVLRESESQFLEGFLSKSRVTKQTVGVDFRVFRPFSKSYARSKLGLPDTAVIMLYIGKFYRLKGVDLIIEAYRKLKTKMKVELVLIGGSPGDELYESVKSSGAIYYGHLPHDALPLYLSAADIYVHPAFAVNYWGIDVSVIEALACGVPVVSPILEEFPGHIRQGLGEIPENKDEVMKCILKITQNPRKYDSCRALSKPYYDWSNVIARTEKVYDRLFAAYHAKIR